VKLKLTSLLFIVVLGVNLLIAATDNAGGTWGLTLPLFVLLILLGAYSLFWIGGNLYLWTTYRQPDRPLVGVLLNLPALIVAAVAVPAWINSLPPTAAFTLQVLDEQGQPLPGAEVRFGGGSKKNAQRTDEAGQVQWRGPKQGGPFYSVEREGFYPNWGNIQLEGEAEGVWPFRRLQPWNPTFTTYLRAVRNPIPLYVKRMAGISIEVLRDGEPRGFDLQRGDWVVPAGGGAVTDFAMQLVSGGHDGRSLTLWLRFPGEANGIQRVEADPHNAGSLLRLPYHAPEQGYRPELALPVGDAYFPRLDDDRERQGRDNYFFRVRGRHDAQGRFAGALYGKVIGPIRPFHDPRQNHRLVLYMHYGLNPTPDDTNLEFDPARNLLRGEEPHDEMTTAGFR
jgi:hypothetical protein